MWLRWLTISQILTRKSFGGYNFPDNDCISLLHFSHSLVTSFANVWFLRSVFLFHFLKFLLMTWREKKKKISRFCAIVKLQDRMMFYPEKPPLTYNDHVGWLGSKKKKKLLFCLTTIILEIFALAASIILRRSAPSLCLPTVAQKIHSIITQYLL